jgi:drug/metabolite transporter (DMT)-like permease
MTTSMTQSLGYVAIYVALAGVASFIEMPAGRGFGAFQLNALIRVGSLAAAVVALAFGQGIAFPAGRYLFAGLGIGLLSGVGSILYCFGLDYLPVSLVVTLSNLYIVITVVLGIVVLHEPVTVLKIAGLICILAGVLILARAPARHAANPEVSSASMPVQARGLAIMGIYVVMIGVSSFLEKPALKGLTPTQLNVLMGNRHDRGRGHRAGS